MTFILRNLWRRKGRTFLTIFGIVVGIFALTVLGAMTARLNQQVNGMKGLIAGKISVTAPGTSMLRMQHSKVLNLDTARQIEKVPGVQSASGIITVQLKEGAGMSQPQMLVGYEVGSGKGLFANVGIAKGRELKAGDTGKAVVGSQLATDLDAKVGDKVTLKGKQFEVVGIMDATLGTADTWAFASYSDVLPIFLAENPYFKAENFASSISVLPKPGVNIDSLAETIGQAVPDIKVISPAEAEKQISQMTTIFKAIILGIAFIALFVGGLSIINTMVMAVSERTREIGLKKAIGAKVWTILAEYLAEAAMIGFVAGAVGMLLGLVAISMLNRATHNSNITIFTASTTVIVGPVLFATALGTLAGFFPALRAARLNPVDSLKEE